MELIKFNAAHSGVTITNDMDLRIDIFLVFCVKFRLWVFYIFYC